MQILKRGKIVYYIKDESIIVGINNLQYIAYTVYMLQNRKPFYDLKRTLEKSNENEYDTVIEQIKLGQRFGLRAVSSSRPSEIEE